jgi:hypothetical protein
MIRRDVRKLIKMEREADNENSDNEGSDDDWLEDEDRRIEDKVMFGSDSEDEVEQIVVNRRKAEMYEMYDDTSDEEASEEKDDMEFEEDKNEESEGLD